MKRVFPKQDDVISRWISQSQDSARTSDYRIHFEGDYIYSGHRLWKDKTIIKRTIGKRLRDDLFLVARYRHHSDGHKLYGVIWALNRANKKYYSIKSFKNQNENVEDFKRLIKKRKNSIMRSTANLSWRIKSFKKIIKEYNEYIDEFNLRLTKIDESFMDNKIDVRKVTLKLKGIKFY